MLNKTYALGLLAATALVGCIFTPSAQASQLEVDKQTGTQNAAAVGTGNSLYQNLNQINLQNALPLPGQGYYPFKPTEPQMQISDQDATQSGAAIGTNNSVYQNLNQINLQNPFGL